MKTNFKTFSAGDKVLANTEHPYYNSEWLNSNTLYTVEKMLDTAGVVTLKGLPWNKTFPDDMFILVAEFDMEKFDAFNSSNEGSSP